MAKISLTLLIFWLFMFSVVVAIWLPRLSTGPDGPAGPTGPWIPWMPWGPVAPVAPAGPAGPWGPVAPVFPVKPVFPLGMVKLKTAALLVPVFVTEAFVPAKPVVVVPIAVHVQR